MKILLIDILLKWAFIPIYTSKNVILGHKNKNNKTSVTRLRKEYEHEAFIAFAN